MSRTVDPTMGNTLVDNNTLDHTSDAVEEEALERIMSLAADGEINLVIPYSVQREIDRPSTPEHVRRRAQYFAPILTVETTLTADEIALRRKVRGIVQGNAKPGKHEADAEHLAEASKYGQFFVTCDKRLIAKREELNAQCMHRGGFQWYLHIMLPSEYVAAYDAATAHRAARRASRLVTSVACSRHAALASSR